MIPILYDTNETLFTSNGLGRLRDCISCLCTEERNGIYECDFQYPVSGANFDKIQVGRVIGITHDETDDIQPFDIVSYSRPINEVVTFHCVHISYRMSYMTAVGSNINSLADAFTLLGTAEPTNPFNYQSDKTSSGYMACADGLPHSVRSMLGGIEGSILDAYGGEYEFDKWKVYLHSSRGQLRDFTIRYGVNMMNYNEDYSLEGTYMSCIPYWTDNSGNNVIGDKVSGAGVTITGRDECVPLNLSDKFETQPTKAEVESMALSYLNNHNTVVPTQNIKVEFARLQDLGMEEFRTLMTCRLCDTIKVIFPSYNSTGTFKIVKTVWNVLMDRYDSMELGDLSTTLSEALGITNSLTSTGEGNIHIKESGVSGNWHWRKWSDGTAECWGTHSWTISSWSGWGGTYYTNYSGTINYPSSLFNDTPTVTADGSCSTGDTWLGSRGGTTYGGTKDHTASYYFMRASSGSTGITGYVNIHAIGKWQ